MRQNGSLMLKEEVDADEIAAIVSRWTGIPVARMMEGEIEKLLHMEARLHQRVVGQEDAIQAVSAAVRRSRAGLQDPNRPVGDLPVLGPDWRGQDGDGAFTGPVSLRRRKRDGADRHERI